MTRGARMVARGILAVILLLTRSVSGAAETVSAWPDADRLEAFLISAEVVDRDKIGVGVTDSSKITLELDKYLGLGMVPPTVERSIKGRRGGVQLWVEGEVMNTSSQDPNDLELWRLQVSTMWLFDFLVATPTAISTTP